MDCGIRVNLFIRALPVVKAAVWMRHLCSQLTLWEACFAPFQRRVFGLTWAHWKRLLVGLKTMKRLRPSQIIVMKMETAMEDRCEDGVLPILDLEGVLRLGRLLKFSNVRAG